MHARTRTHTHTRTHAHTHKHTSRYEPVHILPYYEYSCFLIRTLFCELCECWRNKDGVIMVIFASFSSIFTCFVEWMWLHVGESYRAEEPVPNNTLTHRQTTLFLHLQLFCTFDPNEINFVNNSYELWKRIKFELGNSNAKRSFLQFENDP